MGIGKGTEMGKKVLITASHYEELCGEAKALFERNGYELVINQKDMPYYTFEELSQLVTDVDGVVLGLDEWNEAVFKIAPRLKVLAKFGVGVDNIDLEKAKEYGIKVLNARGKNANAVAELAVAFILNAMRQIPWLDGELKEGSWHRFVGRELAGKTVGLLGFGDIARRVAKKLSGFDVRLIACDKYPDEEAAKRLNVTMVSQEELLGESDRGQHSCAQYAGQPSSDGQRRVCHDEARRLFYQYGQRRTDGYGGALRRGGIGTPGGRGHGRV